MSEERVDVHFHVGPIEIHLHVGCQCCAGDKEKLVALTQQVNAKAAQWAAILKPDASK